MYGDDGYKIGRFVAALQEHPLGKSRPHGHNQRGAKPDMLN